MPSPAWRFSARFGIVAGKEGLPAMGRFDQHLTANSSGINTAGVMLPRVWTSIFPLLKLAPTAETPVLEDL